MKSSWGIVIFLEINEILGSEEGDIILSENVNLKTTMIDSPFMKDLIFWYKKVLIDFAFLIPQDISITYELVDIEFSDSDFQVEGLYYSFMEWLALFYKKEIPKYDYYFDENLNKYIFPNFENA